MDLAEKQCVPCRGGVPPMAIEQAQSLLAEIGSGWSLNKAGHLERKYPFANFVEAMAFANQVADIAEAQAHHPDLQVRWGECTVEIWTHKIDGLTESDFYFAAKCDRAYSYK